MSFQWTHKHELCGEDDLASVGLLDEPPADDFLGQAKAVDVGRVNEVATLGDKLVQDLMSDILRAALRSFAKSHGSQAQVGHLQTGVAKVVVLHFLPNFLNEAFSVREDSQPACFFKC